MTLNGSLLNSEDELGLLCCSVVAVCCIVLQCAAESCSVLQCAAVYSNML